MTSSGLTALRQYWELLLVAAARSLLGLQTLLARDKMLWHVVCSGKGQTHVHQLFVACGRERSTLD